MLIFGNSFNFVLAYDLSVMKPYNLEILTIHPKEVWKVEIAIYITCTRAGNQIIGSKFIQ